MKIGRLKHSRAIVRLCLRLNFKTYEKNKLTRNMEFKLTINMDKDAFKNDRANELIRILQKLTKTLSASELEIGDSGSAIDSNGNTVGTWEISE